MARRAPFQRYSTARNLDELVNEHTRALNRSNNLPRDVFKLNRSAIADEFIGRLHPKLRDELGENAMRPPYTAHAALAVLDSKRSQSLHDYYGAQLTNPNFDISPRLGREQTQVASEYFGREPVLDTIHWLARELSARHRVYGTRGIYLRTFFLSECAKFRRVLGANYQPPDDWATIIAYLIGSGAIKVIAYHSSNGSNYLVFAFNGSQSRY